jgi:uncharacterized protein YegL
MYNGMMVPPMRINNLFLIVDTCGGMAGERIDVLNRAIPKMLSSLEKILQDSLGAYELKVAAMTFSSGARWIYDRPRPLEEFVWPEVHAGGVCDIGEAFGMLEEALHRKAFMRGGSPPVFILITLRDPTDDYRPRLEKLKENRWFHYGQRIALAVGEGANRELLVDFVDAPENIITAESPEKIEQVLSVLVQNVHIISTIGGGTNLIFLTKNID